MAIIPGFTRTTTSGKYALARNARLGGNNTRLSILPESVENNSHSGTNSPAADFSVTLHIFLIALNLIKTIRLICNIVIKINPFIINGEVFGICCTSPFYSENILIP